MFHQPLVAAILALAATLTSPDDAMCPTAERRGDGPATTHLPSPPPEVCHERPCVFSAALLGAIDEKMADDLEVGLGRVVSQAHPDAILLVISSPGGRFDSSRRINAAIKTSPVPIYCYALNAASGAFWAFQACHERAVASDSWLLTHGAALYIPQGPAIYKRALLAAEIKKLERMEIEMAASVAPRMLITEAALRARWAGDSDWEFNGAQALALHAADIVDDDMAHYLKTITVRLAKK